MLGILLGFILGNIDGDSVGSSDGLSLGSSDDDITLGSLLGSLLGNIDGNSKDICEGSSVEGFSVDGSLLISSVGPYVCSSDDGSSDCISVGCSDIGFLDNDSSVGAFVSPSVGEFVISPKGFSEDSSEDGFSLGVSVGS